MNREAKSESVSFGNVTRSKHVFLAALLIGLLINAVKEQQTQLEQQQKLNQIQGIRLSQQQQQIETLKRLVCLNHPRAAICK